MKLWLHMLSCFEQGTRQSINGSADDLLIFLSILISQVCYLPCEGGLREKNRLEAHSFLQEWILSTPIWSPFANRHKYSVIALKCTGTNMANCSLWWLRRCSETERVWATGGCKALKSESLRWPQPPSSNVHKCLDNSTTWPKDTWILLTHWDNATHPAPATHSRASW